MISPTRTDASSPADVVATVAPTSRRATNGKDTKGPSEFAAAVVAAAQATTTPAPVQPPATTPAETPGADLPDTAAAAATAATAAAAERHALHASLDQAVVPNTEHALNTDAQLAAVAESAPAVSAPLTAEEAFAAVAAGETAPVEAIAAESSAAAEAAGATESTGATDPSAIPSTTPGATQTESAVDGTDTPDSHPVAVHHGNRPAWAGRDRTESVPGAAHAAGHGKGAPLHVSETTPAAPGTPGAVTPETEVDGTRHDATDGVDGVDGGVGVDHTDTPDMPATTGADDSTGSGDTSTGSGDDPTGDQPSPTTVSAARHDATPDAPAPAAHRTHDAAVVPPTPAQVAPGRAPQPTREHGGTLSGAMAGLLDRPSADAAAAAEGRARPTLLPSGLHQRMSMEVGDGELGRMRLDASTHNGEVRLSLTSADAATSGLVNAKAHELLADLRQAGVKVAQLDVRTGTPDGGATGQQHQRTHRDEALVAERSAARAATHSAEHRTGTTGVGPSSSSSSSLRPGLDRVDLFI